MTTTMVSLDGLRELAAFRAENGCAISLYLDLDPSRVPDGRRHGDAGPLAARSGGEVARRDAPRPGPRGSQRAEGGLRAARSSSSTASSTGTARTVWPCSRTVWTTSGASLPCRGRCRTRRASPTTSCWRRSSRCSGADTVCSSPSSAGSRDACWRSGTVAWSRLRTEPRRRRASTTRAAGRRPGSSGTSRTWRTSTTGPWPTSWKRGSAGSAGRASSSSAATRPAPNLRRRWRRRSPMR